MHSAQAPAYVYARETKADADTAKVLTMDEARRVDRCRRGLSYFSAPSSLTREAGGERQRSLSGRLLARPAALVLL